MDAPKENRADGGGDGLLKREEISSREYQERIAKSVLEKGNTLVVLPTGLGKTIIALFVMEDILAMGKSVLFLAPTRPLAEQHMSSIRKFLKIGDGDSLLLTGETHAKERAELWKGARIIVATPQTVRNDLLAGASLEGCGLVIFDEAHRSVGNYAYTFIAERAHAAGTLLLGLTASPGSSKVRINEIMRTLGIQNVEMRTEADKDVREYVQPLEMRWVRVDLPAEIIRMKWALEQMIEDKARTLQKLGYARTRRLTKTRLIEIREKILREPVPAKRFIALSAHAALFNLLHAHELLETQGVMTFLDFVARLEAKDNKSRAVRGILRDKRFLDAVGYGKELEREHPKLGKLIELIEERNGKSFIVFVQYRDQISHIVRELKQRGKRAEKFVGKKEVSQKEQKEIIERFRRGEFDILVASSIGEEGLDIPSVDCVIFYEPIPSAIRSIQRRGRVGRAKPGEAIILITKGTRDEAYFWASVNREKKMREIITAHGREKKPAKGKQEAAPRGQKKLSEFFG